MDTETSATSRAEHEATASLRLEDIRGRATVSVEQAGQVLGFSRGASYAAAKRGELPTIRMGRRIVVPVPALLAMLGER